MDIYSVTNKYHNIKLDALAHQFQKGEIPDQDVAPILCHPLVVVTVSKEIEEGAEGSCEGSAKPQCLPQPVFVPLALRSELLKWAHLSKLAC